MNPAEKPSCRSRESGITVIHSLGNLHAEKPKMKLVAERCAQVDRRIIRVHIAKQPPLACLARYIFSLARSNSVRWLGSSGGIKAMLIETES